MNQLSVWAHVIIVCCGKISVYISSSFYLFFIFFFFFCKKYFLKFNSKNNHLGGIHLRHKIWNLITLAILKLKVVKYLQTIYKNWTINQLITGIIDEFDFIF